MSDKLLVAESGRLKSSSMKVNLGVETPSDVDVSFSKDGTKVVNVRKSVDKFRKMGMVNVL